MNILIADDDPISNKLLADSLRRWGHDVTALRDGNDAWEALQQETAPRLAILDWMMPGLSGVEVCRKLRALNRLYYTYIILLTSKAEKDDIVEGLKAGADDYLTKPFNPRELEVRIGVGARVLNLESELQNALEHLKTSERNLTHFVSAMTHDLRTPLVAEQRALELILAGEGDRLSTRGQRLLKGLSSNNQDLLKLVNQLLESFHASEVKITLHKEPVSLKPLVDECFQVVDTLAHRKQLTLLNQIPDALATVQADPEQLKRILNNLISNAIAHLPDGGTIRIAAQSDDGHVEIRVQDNGPGIPPELLPHLFERYHSGAGVSRKIGSGLGLSICKTLVELHEGTIWVESTQGEGASFCFTLPMDTEHLPGSGQAAPISVFIVEEQELTRLGLKVALEELEQVQVVNMAENCSSIERSLSQHPPDIILLGATEDSNFCRRLRQNGGSVKTKLLMLVSADSKHDLLQSFSQGADGYCPKNSKARHLEIAMRAVLQNSPWLDPTLAEALTANSGPSDDPSKPELSIDPSQRQVLQSIATATPEELSQRLQLNTNHISRQLASLLHSWAIEAVKSAL